MKVPTRSIFPLLVIVLLALSTAAQVDEICSEFGHTPSLDPPNANVPYVFGRVVVKGQEASSRRSKVTITLVDAHQTQKRITVEKTGNYCFRRSAANTYTLVIDVDDLEVARKSFSSFGPNQQREDFDILRTNSEQPPPPGTLSAKFFHPSNEKTVELYRKAANAERNNDIKNAIKALNEIVSLDAADFIAWAKLGTLHLEGKSYADADVAFRRSLTLRPDYTPAWINAGKSRVAQKLYDAAIEIYKYSITLDPAAARIHQLLGETYLLAKQGSLGVESLNKALQIDPLGMAECHLQLAHLYQLAGAKQLAAREYKLFIEKRPAHPERDKFVKFIKENP